MTAAPQCAILGCTKPARWKTSRVDKISARLLCDHHLAEKIGKYELTKIERLKG